MSEAVQAVGIKRFQKALKGTEGQPRGSCSGCGRQIWSEPVLHIPGLHGDFDSVACLETALFGEGRCRWCGARMSKAYTSVDSRLCSDDCSANYYAHVLGDRSARLGTGKRLLLWLQRNQPEVYEALIQSEGHVARTCTCCGKDIAHLRAGAQVCSHACEMRVRRAS